MVLCQINKSQKMPQRDAEALTPYSEIYHNDMKLLVIEDSLEVQQRLCQMLATIPRLSVAATDSVAAGLEQLHLTPPDVVILDLQLSDGDGLQVLRIAKREVPAVQVFVLTNHVFRRQLCLKEGADGFFDKSMEFGTLLNAVKTLAAKSPEQTSGHHG